MSRRHWSNPKHTVWYVSEIFHPSDEKELLEVFSVLSTVIHRAECHSGQVLCAVLPCLCAVSILRLVLEFRRSTKNVLYVFFPFPLSFYWQPCFSRVFLYHRGRTGKCSSPCSASTLSRPWSGCLKWSNSPEKKWQVDTEYAGTATYPSLHWTDAVVRTSAAFRWPDSGSTGLGQLLACQEMCGELQVSAAAVDRMQKFLLSSVLSLL